MTRPEPRGAWRTSPARHPHLAPLQDQRKDSPNGAIAVACFVLALVLLAIAL